MEITVSEAYVLYLTLKDIESLTSQQKTLYERLAGYLKENGYEDKL
jgi:hypothetical protein